MTARRLPPQHLAKPTREWWSGVVRDYDLEPHHVRLLTAASEAWDRMTQARELLADEGLVVRDRFGQPKPHPAAAIERDSRIGFARLLRELDLDGEPTPDPRLPRQT